MRYQHQLFVDKLFSFQSISHKPLTQTWQGVVVVIVWWLDLKLPVQSVPIITKVVSSNDVHDEMYSIQHYVIKFVSDLRQVGD
jgi:hypothetical protein